MRSRTSLPGRSPSGMMRGLSHRTAGWLFPTLTFSSSTARMGVGRPSFSATIYPLSAPPGRGELGKAKRLNGQLVLVPREMKVWPARVKQMRVGRLCRACLRQEQNKLAFANLRNSAGRYIHSVNRIGHRRQLPGKAPEEHRLPRLDRERARQGLLSDLIRSIEFLLIRTSPIKGKGYGFVDLPSLGI